MKRTHFIDGARFLRTALCLGAVSLLFACASESGGKAAEAPFPELADTPPRPQAGSTPEERAALRKQLEQRRDAIREVSASLLRGGTGSVPVALESQIPAAPEAGTGAPPPLPDGLPPPPERPAVMPETGAPAKPVKKTPAPDAADKDADADGEDESDDG